VFLLVAMPKPATRSGSVSDETEASGGINPDLQWHIDNTNLKAADAEAQRQHDKEENEKKIKVELAKLEDNERQRQFEECRLQESKDERISADRRE
jgi:hypothetical protein